MPVVPTRLVGTDKVPRRDHGGLPRIRVVVGESIAVVPDRPAARRKERLMGEVEKAVRSLG